MRSNYDRLLRLEALKGILDASCEINGHKISSPKECILLGYEDLFNEYQCTSEQTQKAKPGKQTIDRKKNIVQKAMQLEKLYKEREKNTLNMRALLRDVSEENMYTPGYNVQCEEQYTPNFVRAISIIDNAITNIASREPILFAKANSSKSIFDQNSRSGEKTSFTSD